MLKKKYVYNILIIILYMVACIFIYQDTNYTTIKKDYINPKGKSPVVTQISSNKEIIATLEIPKINLYENIYEISNKQSAVDNHVVILENSTFPVEKSSIVFIAAHSGSGRNAYFNKIDELSTGDVVKFYYKNKLYTYLVEKSWEADKDGKIEVSKYKKHELILTTCSKKDDNKQLIIRCTKKEE